MPVRIVQHQSQIDALNWIRPELIVAPKTLVLGSFNPFNPANAQNHLHAHYGRSANYFWRAIAIACGQDEEWFYNPDNGRQRKLDAMTNHFCCMDFIDSISFRSEDDDLLKVFVDDHVFTNFRDQTIWRTATNGVSLTRNYNNSIIDLLLNTKSIETVIHTFGKGWSKLPIETGLGDAGLQAFQNQIRNTCQERHITFLEDVHLSPSGYAVNNGYTDLDELVEFYRANLL